MKDINKIDTKKVLEKISSICSVEEKNLQLLNAGAPNSWTILNQKSNEVWKVITPKALRYKDRLHRFLEKEAIDKLRDDIGVVKYLKEGNLNISGSASLPYLVFPYVKGKPLDKEILGRVKVGKKFADEEIEEIGKQVVKSISEMYKSGVIHQDIKPGNIILQDDAKVSILDLGISRFVYEDIKYIKRMEGPYAYLSPERLDMIADFSVSNKRCLNFPSDLFSLGMILFQMATLKRVIDVVQPGEVRSFYQTLGGYSFSPRIKDILTSLLHEEPLERQELVSQVFGVEWFLPKEVEDVSWWIQHSSNGWGYVKDFITDNKPENHPGVILAADQKGREDTFLKRSDFIHSKGWRVAMDPVTFRLQYDDEHHGYLKLRPFGYRISPSRFIEPAQVGNATDFVFKVLEFELGCKPDILIAPYFAVDSDETSSRWLDANFSCWRLSLNFVESKKISIPLYFGLVLSERVVSNEKDLNQIVKQILFDVSIKNVYLRLETDRKGSNPNKNLRFIENMRKTIALLSKSKNIIYSFADIEVFGYFGDGLSSFAINPDYEKRKQVVFDKYTKPRQIIHIDPEKRRKRYFAHKLWNDILADAELRSAEAISLGSESIFHCDCPYCFDKGNDRRLDPDVNRKHFLYHTSNFVSDLAKEKSLVKRKEIFSDKLEKARESYKFLKTKCHMSFDKETDGDFIDVWEKAFGD